MKDNILKWLSAVAGRQKYKILLLAAIQAILGGSSVLYALLLRGTVDAAFDKDKSGFVITISAVVGLVFLQIILRAAIRRLEELSRSELENTLKLRLFSTVFRKTYASVMRIHSGEWMNRLTSDTLVTANGMTEILPGVIGMAVKMAGALIMLLIFEVRFIFVLVPGGSALILLTYVFRKKLKKLHKTIQKKDGILRIFMQEHLSSLVIVKTFSAENSTRNEAADKMSEHRNARMKRSNFSNLCNIGFAAAMNGMYILGLAYCGFGIIGGTVSYGTLTAVLQLISQIQSPMANITGYFPKFYAMTASAERLREAEYFEDDCTEEPVSEEEIKNFYKNNFSAIELKNIGFAYKNDVQVFDNVNLRINKGENIAFTGYSGCGKSTLLKLLMCLYSPDSGEINLVEINDNIISLASNWHRLFAYVPQGNHLMSGTVRDIVTLGREISHDKLKTALRISCADEFVDCLEKGLDTVIGENGLGLSEGQMQRIAVARAIYSDNPILLLDEATSALDEQTERRVLENIRSMTDKTVLIITHRPAALEICDKIINFSESEVKL